MNIKEIKNIVTESKKENMMQVVNPFEYSDIKGAGDGYFITEMVLNHYEDISKVLNHLDIALNVANIQLEKGEHADYYTGLVQGLIDSYELIESCK